MALDAGPPEDILKSAPDLVRWIIFSVVGFGAGLFWLFNLIKGWKSPERTPHKLVLETAEVADMGPIRALIPKMERVFQVADDSNEKITEALTRLERIESKVDVQRAIIEADQRMRR